MKRLITILFLVVFVTTNFFATRILIPMDEENQRNHLKAYGIAYWILQNEIEVEWLLNYRGGSFLVCLLYTSPSPRDGLLSRMPSSA